MLPGHVEVDQAVVLLVIACGTVGIGVLIVLLTHLVNALAALVPAGVGLSVTLGRKKR